MTVVPLVSVEHVAAPLASRIVRWPLLSAMDIVPLALGCWFSAETDRYDTYPNPRLTMITGTAAHAPSVVHCGLALKMTPIAIRTLPSHRYPRATTAPTISPSWNAPTRSSDWANTAR